jgi:hypothetical protein
MRHTTPILVKYGLFLADPMIITTNPIMTIIPEGTDARSDISTKERTPIVTV